MRRVLLAIACAGCGSFRSTPEPEAVPDASTDAPSAVDAGPTDAGCVTCAETVVANVPAPTTLFARAGKLYFTDGSKDLHACDEDACTPVTLSEGPLVKVAVAASSAGLIAIDATCVSALRSDGVYLYDANGQATAVLGDPCPTSVAAAGSFTFFASTGLLNQGTSWAVKRCSATACEAIAASATTSSFGTPKLVAVTGSDVYVGSSNGRLLHWPNQPNAGTPEELLSGEFLLELVTDGTSLAWLDGTRVRACTIADCSNTVHAVALDATAKHLAADATGLYWTSAGSGDTDGKVFHAAPDARTGTPIATGQSAPSGIATDDGYVYWSEGTCDGCAIGEGAIRRRREP